MLLFSFLAVHVIFLCLSGLWGDQKIDDFAVDTTWDLLDVLVLLLFIILYERLKSLLPF